MHKEFLDNVSGKDVIEVVHWIMEYGTRNVVKMVKIMALNERKDKQFQNTKCNNNTFRTKYSTVKA